MRRIFGEYGMFIVVAILALIILAFALSGQNNGFLGENGIGGMKPTQTTKSETNSETIKSLYEHKDPVLTITPVTLKTGQTYDFYTDFTTEAYEYLSDGTTHDIFDRVEIKAMTYLSRSDMSEPDAVSTVMDLNLIDPASYLVLETGIYEITYTLIDNQGFETTGTYQFPAD